MSAKTRTDERLEELSDRIDQLEAKAQASGPEAKESMKEQVDELRRQEASARAALRKARDDSAEEVEEKLARLDKRVEMALAEQRLDELYEASGERLGEEKTAATRGRAALDRQVDEALKKFG